MSQFRQDIISGDWIIIAPERSKRPDGFVKKGKRLVSPKSKCPFENLQKSGNWPPRAIWPEEKNWRLAVIPNKFPILSHSEVCSVKTPRGPYFIEEGVGEHDLIVTRDHDTPLYALKEKEINLVFSIIQERFAVYSKDKCLYYASAFMNWGPGAGASLIHPHLQVLSTPIVPPDVTHSLHGAERYHKKHKKCAHCEVIRYEQAEKSRVIFQNKYAIAIAPFASQTPFEVRIFPKIHNPFFDKESSKVINDIAKILRLTLQKIAKKLNDPDLNFFIHSAPLKDRSHYRYYHWHLEVLPRHIVGGLEMSTGVQVNPMLPEEVARFLGGHVK
ncbi:MAG: hypothetical protein KGZ30_04420 [Anaplasmataceae bacterium]|nr:hypothetical protein [Anaplasmataceae bacterium]